MPEHTEDTTIGKLLSSILWATVRQAGKSCESAQATATIKVQPSTMIQETFDLSDGQLDLQPFPAFFQFLADRTNGRAIATLLRLSSVTLCIVAKRCVLEQKLLWRAYRKSYMRNRLVPK